MKHNQHSEQGVTAILMVIFFTILMSVITLSFLRVGVLEQTQSLQDQLSKSAYAAAQSGIEDGKRAMLYCQANPGSACTNLNDGTCPGFFGKGDGTVRTTGVTAKLGLTVANNSIQVGDASLNETYTCVIINNDTFNIAGQLNPKNLNTEPSSDFFPLIGTKPIDKVVVYWGQVSDTLAIPPKTKFSGGANLKDTNTQWLTDYPGLMRLMLLENKPGLPGFKNDTEDAAGTQSQSYFVYPITGATQGSINAFSDIASRQDNVADCSTSGKLDDSPPFTKWACKVTLNVDSTLTKYIALQAYYAPTRFAVELYNGSEHVKFKNVRPTIDSTGQAGNVFRRVQATLQPGIGTKMQPVALDVYNRLCKNFVVTNNPNDFTESCKSN